MKKWKKQSSEAKVCKIKMKLSRGRSPKNGRGLFVKTEKDEKWEAKTKESAWEVQEKCKLKTF